MLILPQRPDEYLLTICCRDIKYRLINQSMDFPSKRGSLLALNTFKGQVRSGGPGASQAS